MKKNNHRLCGYSIISGISLEENNITGIPDYEEDKVIELNPKYTFFSFVSNIYPNRTDTSFIYDRPLDAFVMFDVKNRIRVINGGEHTTRKYVSPPMPEIKGKDIKVPYAVYFQYETDVPKMGDVPANWPVLNPKPPSPTEYVQTQKINNHLATKEIPDATIQYEIKDNHYGFDFNDANVIPSRKISKAGTISIEHGKPLNIVEIPDMSKHNVNGIVANERNGIELDLWIQPPSIPYEIKSKAVSLFELNDEIISGILSQYNNVDLYNKDTVNQFIGNWYLPKYKTLSSMLTADIPKITHYNFKDAYVREIGSMVTSFVNEYSVGELNVSTYLTFRYIVGAQHSIPFLYVDDSDEYSWKIDRSNNADKTTIRHVGSLYPSNYFGYTMNGNNSLSILSGTVDDKFLTGYFNDGELDKTNNLQGSISVGINSFVFGSILKGKESEQVSFSHGDNTSVTDDIQFKEVATKNVDNELVSFSHGNNIVVSENIEFKKMQVSELNRDTMTNAYDTNIMMTFERDRLYVGYSFQNGVDMAFGTGFVL